MIPKADPATGWALLSALFAGLTAILAKLGTQGVSADLATAVRTTVVLVLAWGIVAVRGEFGALRDLPLRAAVLLALSGLATGISWMAYFRALSTGDVSRVAPIDKLSFVLAALLGILLLGERVTWQLGAGLVLIAAGVLLTMRG